VGSPTLATLLDEWLDERQSDRGLSAHTEAAYRNDLRVLAERIAAPGDRAALERLTAADLTTAAIRGALAELARDGRAPSSRNRVRSTTGSLCRWLVNRGLLLADPTVEIDRPAQPRRLPVALTDDELGAVLAAATSLDLAARLPWPERDRALVAVLAGAGLRASELCGVNLADLTWGSEPTIRVRGKGSKERTVPLPPEVAATITAYLESRDQRVNAPTQQALFLGNRGNRLQRRGLDHLVTSWFTRAGVRQPPGEAAHAFRHTYAVGLVANGAGLPAVQELLGHSNLATTSVYLRATAAHLHETVRAAPVRGLLTNSNATEDSAPPISPRPIKTDGGPNR
jgi:site-specific recombinase XerD